MFGIKNKEQKEKKKMRIRLKHKIKSKAIKKAKSKSIVLKSSIQKAKTPVIQTQIQNQPQRYRDTEFTKYRTKTLATAISETANTNSMAVFKEQISDLKELSVMYKTSNYDYFNLQHDIVLLDKIIDFVEISKSLLDQKYTEPVWHIMAELYHLKSMISNLHIYNTDEAKKEANEIMQYAYEHL